MATDVILVRSLPRMAWLFIVIVLPDIGSIAWLALGRPQFAGWRPGDTEGRVVGPEDRPDLSPKDTSRLQAWERTCSAVSRIAPAEAGRPAGDANVLVRR